MSIQNLTQVSIDPQRLKQVQLEIENELSQVLSQCNLTHILKKYELPDIDFIRLKLITSPTELKLDVGIDKIKVASLLVSSEISTLDCETCICWCFNSTTGTAYRCPCP
ncbi:hypothetical protein Cylst_2416 [Cylindrospermum stagnale PCC 7417]|uniref:Uncharacterized protein n=1 Tax=Cylindrospermum stagnale PCC 7417 TaxID=56107 RepID=K9WW89_9NOST|nr:hypothetical protein Cylst_2416 [Cylindrospermum stagnale PCC 7417]